VAIVSFYDYGDNCYLSEIIDNIVSITIVYLYDHVLIICHCYMNQSDLLIMYFYDNDEVNIWS